jgi:hypothetical protein
VSGGLEKDRSGCPRWLIDGKHNSTVVVKGVEEEEGLLHRGVLLL